MSEQPFGLGPIGQVMIPVRSVERATEFYRDVLGMRFLFAFPHMAFFDADGVRLYLAEPETDDFRGRATVYFRVTDIDAAVASLEARGVTFSSPPHVVHEDGAHRLWMCFTKDPDGNNLGLMSEVPVGAAGDSRP